MTADNPDPILPLPLAALVIVKFQSCPHCHQRFEREDVVRVGLATENLERDTPLAVLLLLTQMPTLSATLRRQHADSGRDVRYTL